MGLTPDFTPNSLIRKPIVWLAADARPDKIAKVALVGGFPGSDGKPYLGGFPVRDGAVPFPGWSEFEGPDSADLDAATRNAVESAAIPVPEGVASGVIRLADERRYEVPVVLVCPEFSPDQAREWIARGEVPALAKSTSISFADIDSGHWPMISAPDALAALLSRLAGHP